MLLSNPKDCPVCKGTHQSGGRIGSYDFVACASVTPTGATQFYPIFNLLVVGAGLGVDTKPEVKLSVQTLQAKLDSLKTARASAGAMAGATANDAVAKLEAEIAELEKA